MQHSLNAQLRYSGTKRLVFLVLGLGMVAMLVVAFRLSPDPRGHGTHEQLGLSPCSVMQILGVRCPACGMTTSWANVTKGRWIAALSANTGGVLLAVMAAVLGPWCIIAGLRGRWGWKPTSEQFVVQLAIGTVAIIVAEWLVRVFLF